jgi:hypothetical protein
MTRLSKLTIYYLLSFLILTTVFFTNLFGILNTNFEDFQKDSESLVIGKLALSEREGIFYESGLTGTYGTFIDTNQYDIYINNKAAPKENYTTYFSQIGGQAILFSFLDKISPFSNECNLMFFYLITAGLTSLIFTLFLKWVVQQFGLITSLITLILIISSYWIIIFSKNIWWSLWSFYLPFILLLRYFEKSRTIQLSLTKIGLFSSVLIFIKCFFTGYEYITTTLIMFIMPVIFYSISDNWSFLKFLKISSSAAFGAIIGIVMSLAVLLLQLSHLNSQKLNGWNYLMETFLRRSYDNPSKYLDPVYNQSMKSAVLDVLKIYFEGNQFVFKYHDLDLSVSFFQCICVLIIATIFTLSKYKSKKTLGLTITLWVSILAPLSWFTIFKSHSFIHTHMNFIVWYMPFMLLGYVLIGNCVSYFFRKKEI